MRYLLFTLISTTLFFGCTNNKFSDAEIDFDHMSIDSCILIADQYDLDEISLLLSRGLSAQIYTRDKNEIFRGLKYFETRGRKENNYYALNKAYSVFSKYYLSKGDIDSADFYSQQTMATANLHDSINILDCIHYRAVFFMMTDQTNDSSLHYLKWGYKLAEEKKEDYKIFLFSSNLGTHYYNQGLYNLAQKMFIRSIEIASKNPKWENAIIYNNIISCMMATNKYNEASEFWEEHADILQIDSASYNGQVIGLNRVIMFQNLNKFDKAGLILPIFSHENIHPSMRSNMVRTKFAQLNHTNKLDELTTRDKQVFTDDLDFFIKQIPNSIIANLQNPFIKSLIPTLETMADSLSQAEHKSSLLMANLHLILGSYYKNINPQKSIYYFEQSLEYHSIKEGDIEEDENTNIAEITDIQKTFTEIQKREVIIQKERQKRMNLIGVIIGLVVVSILLIGIYQKNARIKSIQSETISKEKEALEKEKDLGNRIVEYSKQVIDNNQQIKSKLSLLLPQVSDPVAVQIRQIQREIESLNRVNMDENPKIATAILNEREDLNQKYPGFEDLNKTEKRIFALVEENYKTKDISTLVGVSVQYVRNVKTRIRKKLNLDSSWGA